MSIHIITICGISLLGVLCDLINPRVLQKSMCAPSRALSSRLSWCGACSGRSARSSRLRLKSPTMCKRTTSRRKPTVPPSKTCSTSWTGSDLRKLLPFPWTAQQSRLFTPDPLPTTNKLPSNKPLRQSTATVLLQNLCKTRLSVVCNAKLFLKTLFALICTKMINDCKCKP